jgi:hypothetical protein
MNIDTSISLNVKVPRDEDGNLASFDDALLSFREEYDRAVADATNDKKLISLAINGDIDDSEKRLKVIDLLGETKLNLATVKLVINKAIKSHNLDFVDVITNELGKKQMLDVSVADLLIDHAFEAKSKSACDLLLKWTVGVLHSLWENSDEDEDGACEIEHIVEYARDHKCTDGTKIFTESLIQFVATDGLEVYAWWDFAHHLMSNDRIEPLLEKIRVEKLSSRLTSVIINSSKLFSRRYYDQIISCIDKSTNGQSEAKRKFLLETDHEIEQINPSILVTICQSGGIHNCWPSYSVPTPFETFVTLYVHARDIFDQLCLRGGLFQSQQAKHVAEYEELMDLLTELTCDDLAQLTSQYLFALEAVHHQ